MLRALSGVPNASEPLPGLLTGGQPMPHHFEALKVAGLAAVIDIRDPMEPRPFDEPALQAARQWRFSPGQIKDNADSYAYLIFGFPQPVTGK